MSKLKPIWMIGLLIILFGLGGCQSSTAKNTPAPTETTKQEASAAKAAFTKILNNYNTQSDTFQAYLGDMTSGDVDLPSYKANLTKLHDQSSALLKETKSLQISSRYKEAQDMLTASVTLLDKSIDDVMKYFDSKEKSQLSLAQEEFKQAKRAAYLAQTSLDKQTAADGL